jgi:AraC family transcriptional regulator
MIFIDLVSSISHALPRLVAASARRAHDEMVFGSNIGYAFIPQKRSDTSEPIDIENANTWPSLQATTLGILGTSRIGQVVARTTYQRFGADVIYHGSPASVDIQSCEWGRRQSFDDVLSARAICVVLPWSADLLGQIQKNKFTHVSPKFVLVVWRRSPAIERALIYIGQHYVEPIQLCDLAKVACVSKCHLVRRFTATLGVSPHRFQLLLRLSRAKAMLREGTGITHIAQGVGFFDHSHLDRSFRILLGMTPTQYQQSVDR